jgi:putative transposase
MPHSYAQNHIHLVFSTKNRAKSLARKLLPRLWAYTAAVCKNHGLLTFAVGGMEDHMHLLLRLPPTMTLSNAVALVKSNSSKWIRERERRFAWQEGYGAFSVSSSNVATVIRYIDNQEAHHRRLSFEDEFIALLKKHGIAYDPKYVFGYCRHLRGSCLVAITYPRASAPGLGSFAPFGAGLFHSTKQRIGCGLVQISIPITTSPGLPA